MEITLFLVTIAVYVIFIGLVRWVFKIDLIVNTLAQTAAHLEDIKQQNNVLIKQQEEIIELLEDKILDD